jgi:hypothetical protein
MITKTYSKRSIVASPSVHHTTTTTNSTPTDSQASDISTVRDVGDLAGMGAISMLADDIHFAIDSVDPRQSLPSAKIIRNLRRIRERIGESAEFGRQFRAHHGVQMLFEWWGAGAGNGDCVGDDSIQGELLWLFCHLGAKMRRVDLMVPVEWIFSTAERLLKGEMTIDIIDQFNCCEPFAKVPTNRQTPSVIAHFMLGKVCMCHQGQNSSMPGKDCLGRIVMYLVSRDPQTVALLDMMVSVGVFEACPIITKDILATNFPFSVTEIKALVSVTGSPYGWRWMSKPQLMYIIDTLLAAAADDVGTEWTIYGLSVLINCVDRDDKSEQYEWVVKEGNMGDRILLIQEKAPSAAKPYASLLVAFAIMNTTPRDIHHCRHVPIDDIKEAINQFIIMPDAKGAQGVRLLAGRLADNGWLVKSGVNPGS